VIVFGVALWRSFANRLDKMEATLEAIRERLPGFATTDALGRLGDRMDGRITTISGSVEVLRDRLSRSVRGGVE
jgi:hypothetical protein